MKNIQPVCEYVKSEATKLAKLNSLKEMFDLGIAFGVYSALTILVEDIKMDKEIRDKFIQSYILDNKNFYFKIMDCLDKDTNNQTNIQ